MNFKKLQAMQAKLDNIILAAKPSMTAEERFTKTLCEASVAIAKIYDCDNKGKVDRDRFKYHGDVMDISMDDDDFLMDMNDNWNSVTVEQAHHLTLVEECSDCLHFILSLANQSDIHDLESDYTEMPDINETYIRLQQVVTGMIGQSEVEHELPWAIEYFLSYIDLLGVTTEELEQAYYEKNKVNYERLESGY